MGKDDVNFSIRNTTKGKPPRLPFVQIKEKVLGSSYELSLVFVGDRISRRLNLTYRDKDKPANVLSFPLTKNSGEIFINLKRAQIETNKFENSPSSHIGFLFIHGLLHLKGMQHGGKMEQAEKKLREYFTI
jgi:probable rRNA maturation factor